ncbi:MAG: hypothetical protein ACHP84_08525 [Caulobacterales bacterium]
MSTASQTPASDTRADFLILALIPLVLAAAVSFATPILGDGDTFWHLAAGRWIIAHGSVPHTDPFSYTFAGRPWDTQEWLTEAGMASVFAAAGWGGVMLITGLAVGATAAMMAAWLRVWLRPLSVVATLAIGIACVAPSMLARPHILALPVLALWTVALLDARRRDRPPSLWLIPLMALWANLHSSFIVGLGVAGMLGLEAVLGAKDRRLRTALAWGAFGLAALGAALLTPHGVNGLIFPVKVMGMKTLPIIDEWRGPDFSKLEPVEIALLAGIFVGFWRGVRVPFVRLLALLALVHMTLQHVRQEVVLGVLAPLLLAEPLGRALGAAGAEPAAPPRFGLGPTLLAAFLFVALIAARVAIPQDRVDGKTAPITALAHVPASLRALPVMNDYAFGGYLIFQGVRPYIDGRADMYGDAFVQDHENIMRGESMAVDAAFSRYGVRWTILAPGSGLAAEMATRPGWRRIYADQYAVVDEKVSCAC